MNDLINKFENKEAKICVIGLGYVGLPLSILLSQKGYEVLGIDIDQKKIDCINSGQSYIQHFDSKIVQECLESGRISASCDFKRVRECNSIIICLPTPLNEYREPDLSYITKTLDDICPYLVENQLLSLESTTYPGTTEEILRPKIEKQGFEIGKNFYLSYSPEREDPGNNKYNTSTIPKVVGGSTKNCLKVAISLYRNIITEVIPVSSTRTAEMTKLLENIHRAVNIGLMNEIKPLTDKLGIDLYEVINAAATKPFGFVPYYPGPGLGGHCIPIDPFYLTWKAREFGMHTRFIELAGEINASMPAYVVNKVIEGLNNFSKALKGSKLLVLGISYKKNVDDMRESPSVEIMQLLKDKGAEVDYSDEYFKEFPSMRKFSFCLKSVQITAEVLNNYDAIILATDHDYFDYDLIKNNSKIIIDTRGRYKPLNNILRA